MEFLLRVIYCLLYLNTVLYLDIIVLGYVTLFTELDLKQKYLCAVVCLVQQQYSAVLSVHR